MTEVFCYGKREKRKLYASWGRYLKYLLQFIEQLLHALITNDPHFNDPQLCQCTTSKHTYLLNNVSSFNPFLFLALLNLYEAWLFAAEYVLFFREICHSPYFTD